MTEKFDFEEALKAGQSMTGKGGVLGPLIKQLTEAALELELSWTSIANLRNVPPVEQNQR